LRRDRGTAGPVARTSPAPADRAADRSIDTAAVRPRGVGRPVRAALPRGIAAPARQQRERRGAYRRHRPADVLSPAVAARAAMTPPDAPFTVTLRGAPPAIVTTTTEPRG